MAKNYERTSSLEDLIERVDLRFEVLAPSRWIGNQKGTGGCRRVEDLSQGV
jgi:hypothetical protein